MGAQKGSRMITCDRLGRVFSFSIGLFWAWVGLTKVVHWFGIGQGGEAMSWSAQFPAGLRAVVVCAELACGLLLLFGRERAGLLGGLLLLAMFSIAIAVLPPTANQPCGCGMGAIEAVFSNASPLGRNAAIVGLHALALAAFGADVRANAAKLAAAQAP